MKALNVKVFNPQNDEFEIYRIRFLVKFLILLGSPFIIFFLIRDFMIGKLFSSFLLLLVLSVLAALFIVFRRSMPEHKKFLLNQMLVASFAFLSGIYLIYSIGVERSFSLLYWTYILPLFLLFVTATKQGLFLVSIFFLIITILTIYTDFPNPSLDSLRIRFLFSFSLITIIFFLFTYLMRRDQQSLLTNQLALKNEIIERQRTEEALRQSEEKYRTILENIEDGYYEVDLAGNVTFCNEALCRIWGYPKEEMIGINYKKGGDEESAKKLFLAFNQVFRTKTPVKGFDWAVIRKDGIKRYVNVSISPIKDSHDQPVGFRGICRDVTDQMQAEEALRRSEEKYRTILENLDAGYFEVDLKGNFTFFNDALPRAFGRSRDELTGMNNRQYMDKENAQRIYHIFNRVYASREPSKAFDLEFIREDGAKRSFECSVFLRTGLNGEPVGFRGIARDVTERKRAEKEMENLQEQLRQSQKIEAVGRLAGGIAHDFNNLLTVIKGYSQLALKELRGGDPLREDIEEIEKASQRAADLTQQLLAFSRRQILEFKVIDLNMLIRNLDKMLRRVIGEDIELMTRLSTDPLNIKSDPGQMEQVIINLAINAKDAMPSGGKLTVETARVELDEAHAHTHAGVSPGHYAVLEVSDTGVGMSAEIKEHIFEPFFTTKAIGKGTGLGLSTVYGIVKQSGGAIWVRSEQNKGTTFKIHLPRVEDQADTLMDHDEIATLPHGKEMVLVVEDEPAVRNFTVRLLHQQGYQILEAVNGQDALRIARERTGEKIHLLLTDVVMPLMGGKELAERIIKIHPETKVLFTSGYTDNAIVHHGVLEPGIDFIQKPFSPTALALKVRQVLDRTDMGARQIC
jgi:PAS domain S-box-containing protein